MAKKTKKKAKVVEEIDDILGDPVEEKEEKKAPKKKEKGHVGHEIRIKQGDAEFLGLCVAERGTPSGSQVYLKLNGCVSRWFNTSDII